MIKKIKQLINNRGIHLNNPLHLIKLMLLGLRFVKKYGVKNRDMLRYSFYKMQSDAAFTADVVNNHAQIWERIKPTYSELVKMRHAVPNLKKHYTFSIVISAHDNDTVSSIEQQIYDKFEILFGTIQETAGKASGDYVLFLQPGDFLHPNALFELCFELNRIGITPQLVYFDHDYFVKNTIDKPYYKPGWSPDLLLTNNYINRACAFKRSELAKIKIINQPLYVTLYDIMLKLTEFGEGHHKPGILLSLPDADDERHYDSQENIVRNEAIKRRCIDGIIESNKYGVASLKRNLIGTPRISIIIPTCFTKSYIENCLKSIKKATTYDNYEIIVVDNSRKTPNYGKRRLKNFICKILCVNEPFNWSRLNNLGAKEASGDILIFLNDDTEIITSDWLERMAAEAQRPEIGMVGPLILYKNGIIYSSGMYIRNQRDVNVSFWYEQENSEVYHNLIHYTRPSLITHGVCFAVQKDKLTKSGGFNEYFPVVCNEMVLSFNMCKNGYYNLVKPEVNIIHHVSASRKNIYDTTDDRKRLEEMFSEELQRGDPYFNPYLNSLNINDYSENPNPIVSRLIGSPPIDKEVSISPERYNKVDKIIETMPFFKIDLLIGMRINSNNINNKYPTERFAILCNIIQKMTGAGIILLGGKEDETENIELLNMVNKKDMIISVAGLFSPAEYVYLVKKVDYVIGNDVELCYTACMQGVSTVVISGSGKNSFEWIPIGNSIHIGLTQCGQYYDSYNCSDNNCLTLIQPGDIFRGLERLMILYPSKRKL